MSKAYLERFFEHYEITHDEARNRIREKIDIINSHFVRVWKLINALNKNQDCLDEVLSKDNNLSMQWHMIRQGRIAMKTHGTVWASSANNRNKPVASGSYNVAKTRYKGPKHEIYQNGDFVAGICCDFKEGDIVRTYLGYTLISEISVKTSGRQFIRPISNIHCIPPIVYVSGFYIDIERQETQFDGDMTILTLAFTDARIMDLRTFLNHYNHIHWIPGNSFISIDGMFARKNVMLTEKMDTKIDFLLAPLYEYAANKIGSTYRAYRERMFTQHKTGFNPVLLELVHYPEVGVKYFEAKAMFEKMQDTYA